ncbi:MAG: tetratricopeptide repeat protein [Planctomycetota bacterium]|nr:tetratricopeptide repeat protein [Planctomycetota bacterium]MDA1252769.1 tetratricopeptide repeat protein [Planctomycetota bacterium]
MADSPWIVDVTTEQFETLVIARSMETPIIVDFWAPWCQPCLQLAPQLEKLVHEAGGAVILAKVNIEQEQQLAGMLGVQSIPLVVAFHEGQMIDQFAGVVPEEQLREFVGRLVPSKAEQLVKEALELEESDQVTAEVKLRESLELDSRDATKIILARVILAQGRDAEAAEIITQLEVRGFLEPDAERIKAELDIRAHAEESGGIVAARAAAEANPDDLPAQVGLGDALAVDGKHREACEILLAVVMKDRAGDAGTSAKDQMVKLFEVLGSGNAIVTEFRRKLATALY